MRMGPRWSMNRQFLYLYMTLIVALSWSEAALLAHVQLEAESEEWTSAIKVMTDSKASQGKFLQMKKYGSITFRPELSAAGFYDVVFGYRARDSDRYQAFFVNGKPYSTGIGFRSTSTYWERARFQVLLVEGANKIEIRADKGYIDIDYLELRPISPVPMVSPSRHSWEKGQNRVGLRFKLNPSNQKLKSLLWGRLAVNWQTEPAVWNGRWGKVQIPETGQWLYLNAEALDELPIGRRDLVFRFSDGAEVRVPFEISQKVDKWPFQIVSFDVGHGNSVLYLLPNGENILIDTGDDSATKDRVLPFLRANNLVLHHLWTSHDHADHVGGVKRLKGAFPNLQFKNNRDSYLATNKKFSWGGVTFDVLHSWGADCGDSADFAAEEVPLTNEHDYCPENENSLSVKVSYKGFVFVQGSDIYGYNQEQILRKRGRAAVRAHVYHANHHFHGSVSPDYLIATDPVLIITSANAAVLARGAFSQDVNAAIGALTKKPRGRFDSLLLSFNTGHTILRVKDGDHWTWDHTYLVSRQKYPFEAMRVPGIYSRSQ